MGHRPQVKDIVRSSEVGEDLKNFQHFVKGIEENSLAHETMGPRGQARVLRQC